MIKQQKWLIVEGCPRSGTTILREVLNTNEEIALSLEWDLLRLKLKKEQLIEKYKEIFKEKKEGNIKYFGDKLPLYFFRNYHKKLKEKLGDFYIIHISRNPLFVVSSFKKLRENPSLKYNWNHFFSIKDACILWILAWNKINKIKNNSNVFHLKYEDLIQNPEEILKKISLFLRVKNRFDFSLIEKKEFSLTLNQKELKIVNKYLGEIIKCWHLPLKEIEKKFPKLKNFYFPEERIILKSLTWEFQKLFSRKFLLK